MQQLIISYSLGSISLIVRNCTHVFQRETYIPLHCKGMYVVIWKCGCKVYNLISSSLIIHYQDINLTKTILKPPFTHSFLQQQFFHIHYNQTHTLTSQHPPHTTLEPDMGLFYGPWQSLVSQPSSSHFAGLAY